jgi:ABC-type uncharacterized transport system permease subunit
MKSIFLVSILIVYLISNLGYKKIKLLMSSIVLSIIGGLCSSLMSYPGFYLQGTLKMNIDNKQLLSLFIVHTLSIIFLVSISYPFLKNKLKRRKSNMNDVSIPFSKSLKTIFKQKDRSEREKQKEWIKKNFK